MPAAGILLIVNVVIAWEGVNSKTLAAEQSRVSVPVACVTASFVSLKEVAFTVVPTIVEGTAAPIVAPSTVPPLISAVVIVPAFDIVAPVKLIVPVVVKFVAVIAANHSMVK